MFLPTEAKNAVVNSSGFKSRFGTLAANCYDKEKPDRTIWWLFQRSRVPWGHWPAYSLGKYFFDRPPGRGVIRTGLHVEKGVDPKNAEGYGKGKGRFFGMTPDWAWFGFVEDLRSGRVANALTEIAERSAVLPEVTVEPSFPLDEPELHEQFGYHRFTATHNGALMMTEERPQPNKLPGIGRVTSLRELGDRLARSIAEERWTWINVFLSCAVPFHSEPPAGGGPAWTGGDFWERVLEPLAGWVK
jgi:hypothetical protein